MGRILLFNPSHEMALASDAAQYTPPKHVRQMESDLCLLPLLWANDDDCILTPNGLVDVQGNDVSDITDMIPTPWGWNRSVRNRFLRMGVNPSLMPSEQQLNVWRSYASRAWAADYCNCLYERSKEDGLVANHVSFLRSRSDYEAWVSRYQSVPFIVKSEYSSSGRGNRVFYDQPSSFDFQFVVIDTFYDKLLDFALEFEIAKQEVRYLGLSVFQTTTEGRYNFNYLCSQQQLREMIVCNLSDATVLDRLIETHRQLLSERLLGHYEGIAGIDMMVVRGGLIHPCVEINLRMNMGVLAMKLYDKGLSSLPRSPYGGQSFYPVIEDVKFYIVYTPTPKSAQ